MTLVLVDDHEPFRRRARAMLEAGGFEVLGEAGDATSAVEAARALRPQVVLLDIMLPDRSGFEAAKEIMSLGEPPVVILTSSRDERDYRSLIRGCQAYGFIPKHELAARTLRELLGSRS